MIQIVDVTVHEVAFHFPSLPITSHWSLFIEVYRINLKATHHLIISHKKHESEGHSVSRSRLFVWRGHAGLKDQDRPDPSRVGSVSWDFTSRSGCLGSRQQLSKN